jgi:hypothetical protein
VFQCLTGVNPFAAEDVTACLMRIIHDPIPMPSVYPVGLPPALDAWWARAVAREREDRFPDARTMIAALAGALGIEYHDRSSDVFGATTSRSTISTTAARTIPGNLVADPTVRVRQRRSPALVILGAAALTAVALLAHERLTPRKSGLTASQESRLLEAKKAEAATVVAPAPVSNPQPVAPPNDGEMQAATTPAADHTEAPRARSKPARRHGSGKRKAEPSKVDLGF